MTYSVTVDSPVHGDYLLQNSVRATDPSGTCAPDGVCEVVTAVSSYTVAKSVSAERVHPGETLTYTIEVTNVGRVAYTDDAPASFTDDLTELLEHADYNGDADGGATLTDAVLSWSGPLPIGESRAVSFSVTVHEDAPVGATLRNAVVAPPTSGSPCQPGAPAGDCVTETVVDSPDDGLPVTGGTAGILLSDAGRVLYQHVGCELLAGNSHAGAGRAGEQFARSNSSGHEPLRRCRKLIQADAFRATRPCWLHGNRLTVPPAVR